jgi:alkylhydroperoxidase family enzyme
MPRPIDAPARESFSGRDLETYDAMPTWRVGEHATPYFKTILNAPPFALNRAEFSTLIRTAGERGNTYSHRDREIVDQVLSVELKSNHVQKMHLGDAVSAGVRIEAIEAIRQGHDEDLTPEELLLVTYIRQVVHGTVSDDIFDELEQRLGLRGIIEFTILITGLIMTMRQMQAFACPQPSDAEVDAMIREFRTGERAVPDFTDRVR